MELPTYGPVVPETIKKLWGFELIHVRTPLYGLKRLVVNPLGKSSLHRHFTKDETYLVEQGQINVLIGPRDRPNTIIMYPGDSLRIRPGQWHQFYSPTGGVILEVSTFDDPEDVERQC